MSASPIWIRFRSPKGPWIYCLWPAEAKDQELREFTRAFCATGFWIRRLGPDRPPDLNSHPAAIHEGVKLYLEKF